jgi:cohesin complex subunit SCC1
VRIYNRKAKYLLADCNEAFVKIKMAFRPGVVDLPEENREAQHNQIYLVEEFPNFDAPLPDIADIDMSRHLSLNQSRIDEITMPDEVPTNLQLDEGFGGVGMMDVNDGYTDGDFQNMFYKDGDGKDDGKDLGFMGPSGLKDDLMDTEGLLGDSFMKEPGIFGENDDGGFFGEGPSTKETDEGPVEMMDGAMDNQLMSPPPPSVPPPSVHPQDYEQDQVEQATNAQQQSLAEEQLDTSATAGLVPPPTNDDISTVTLSAIQDPLVINEQAATPKSNQQQADVQNTTVTAEPEDESSKKGDQTTLVANEEEAFALEPLDITGVKDVRIRRKRKLVVDHLMELDGQTMREQLKDFNDIITTLDMAPPTKRLMLWKEMGGVDKLFSLPSKSSGDHCNKIFSGNLHITIPHELVDVTSTQLNEKFGERDAPEEVEQVAAPDQDPTLLDEGSTLLDQSSIQHGRETSKPDLPQTAGIDESGLSIARGDGSAANNDTLNNPMLHTSSVMMENKLETNMNQLNAPAAYNSDDDYEPYSVGPQSVASMADVDRLDDDNLRPPSPAPNQLENTLLSDVLNTDLPAVIEPDMSDLPLPPSPMDEESAAYADDVEDLRRNKRTQQLLRGLQRSFKREKETSFFQLSDGVTRKQAVSKFYSLLVLAKQEATLLQQNEIFGDVFIRQGPKFESILM